MIVITIELVHIALFVAGPKVNDRHDAWIPGKNSENIIFQSFKYKYLHCFKITWAGPWPTWKKSDYIVSTGKVKVVLVLAALKVMALTLALTIYCYVMFINMTQVLMILTYYNTETGTGTEGGTTCCNGCRWWNKRTVGLGYHWVPV